MFLGKPPNIFTVIDEYASWKYQRFPMLAGARRSLLIRFAKAYDIRDVEEITESHILFFVGGELTGFYSEQALKALRQFLWYCRKAGYECIAHNVASRKGLLEMRNQSIVSESLRAPDWEPGFISKQWKVKRNEWADLLTGKWSKRYSD